MIYSILEQKNMDVTSEDAGPSSAEGTDYNNVIVKKPWGYEYLAFENEHVAIWILQLVRKRKTSMHCHPRKKTSLILLQGQAVFHHLDGNVSLGDMDGVVIKNGVFHSTEAYNPLPITPQSENGIWVMEIESPPYKSDLVRMQDAYGRAGTAYEGSSHMVQEPESYLQLRVPDSSEDLKQKFFDCIFTVHKGVFDKELPADDALISVIARGGENGSKNPAFSVGGLSEFREFRKSVENVDLDGYVFLIIEKEKKIMRTADYVFNRIAELGVKEVFAVSGGGAMHLVDAAGKNEDINYVAVYHEQAAAMAAEGYARITGKPGVTLVTSGPGGTNTITGLCGAWIDSIPTIFISGQVTTNTLLEGTGLRQFGIQESDIVSLVKPVTKYAVTVKDPEMIRYHIEEAIYHATSGRPGPVWLDIPLDIQSRLINPDELRQFNPHSKSIRVVSDDLKGKVSKCIDLIKKAERPVVISGYGIRLSHGEEEFIRLVEMIGAPVISSWTSSDLIPSDHDLYIGRSGIMGDRAGNFTVQNADLLLVIGSRMSIPQVGYNFKVFAREAKKIVVDIDRAELEKESLRTDLPIQSDAKEFIEELIRQLEESGAEAGSRSWLDQCRKWKEKYPVVLPEYEGNEDAVNSFYFVDLLSKKLDKDAVIVTDMGTSFTCTMQTFKIKAEQRLFTSSGHASMGFGLPGAIGACFAHGKKTICISGDGGLQMNIQEFQTLVQYKLPVILFVLNNQGYLTIKLMQQNHFGRYVGSDPSSGVGTPDIVKIAQAYGIKADRIADHKELNQKIDSILAEDGPFVCEVMMPPEQQLIPRVSSLKKPDGTIISKPLEDLYPFLDREEFLENMIVKPVEPLK
ncbi:acetolactate synthase large subunit [bacterium BMS3Abin06]|nr:acetolactate synthase large subunit [bacterium BMS3Abin06]